MGVGGKRINRRPGEGNGGNGADGADTSEHAEETEALLDGYWGPYDPRPGAYGPDDPGGGDYDPETGLRLWYNQTPPSQAEPETGKLRWADILTNWPALSLDLHDLYGIDTETDVLDARTWPWLEARILDIIDRPTRLRRALELPDNLTT